MKPHVGILSKEETWAAFKHDQGSRFGEDVERGESAKQNHQIGA